MNDFGRQEILLLESLSQEQEIKNELTEECSQKDAEVEDIDEQIKKI